MDKKNLAALLQFNFIWSNPNIYHKVIYFYNQIRNTGQSDFRVRFSLVPDLFRNLILFSCVTEQLNVREPDVLPSRAQSTTMAPPATSYYSTSSASPSN